MSRLARTNDVLFVSPALPLGTALRPVPGTSVFRLPGTHAVPGSGRLRVHVPPRWLSRIHRLPGLERWLRTARAHVVSRLATPRSQPRILYLWHPGYEPYVAPLEGSLVCFHLHDDLAAYETGTTGRSIEPDLQRLFAHCDLLFTSSRELGERYAHLTTVHWVPNGVDVAPYDALFERPGPLPADLDAIPRPRAGYVGTLRAEVDLALLQRFVTQRPDVSLVLIGNVTSGLARTTEFQALAARPNVFQLGSKASEEIPRYLMGLDLGLLPYRLDAAAQYCYPLKMHEYLAAGLPIVSTALPAVAPFAGVIRIAQGPDEWDSLVREALADTSPERVEARRRVARDNTWDRRVEIIATAIGDALKKRKIAQR